MKNNLIIVNTVRLNTEYQSGAIYIYIQYINIYIHPKARLHFFSNVVVRDYLGVFPYQGCPAIALIKPHTK